MLMRHKKQVFCADGVIDHGSDKYLFFVSYRTQAILNHACISKLFNSSSSLGQLDVCLAMFVQFLATFKQRDEQFCNGLGIMIKLLKVSTYFQAFVAFETVP